MAIITASRAIRSPPLPSAGLSAASLLCGRQGYPRPPSLCRRQGYLRRLFLATDNRPLPSNAKRAGSVEGAGPLGLRGMGGA